MRYAGSAIDATFIACLMSPPTVLVTANVATIFMGQMELKQMRGNSADHAAIRRPIPILVPE